MYCKNCGEPLNENDRVCPACGTPVEKTGPKGAPNNGPQTYAYGGNSNTGNQTYQYSGPQYQPTPDTGSKGWGVLGCCFPLIGLILFLVWKDDKPRSAKAAGIGALIGVILCVVTIMLLFALGIGLSAFGIAEGVANGDIYLDELEDYLSQNTSALIDTMKI
jgi:hypothetical protein